jgi:hypothetical protein
MGLGWMAARRYVTQGLHMSGLKSALWAASHVALGEANFMALEDTNK